MIYKEVSFYNVESGMTHTFLIFLELVSLDLEVQDSSVLSGDLVFRRVGPHERMCASLRLREQPVSENRVVHDLGFLHSGCVLMMTR